MAKKKSVLEKAMEVQESKEVVVEETKVEVVEPPKKAEPKISKEVVQEEFPIQLASEITSISLPSREEVDAYLNMYEYVKSKVVNRHDFVVVSGKKFLKKSGWRKFVKAFNISIELIEKRMFEFQDDIHAEVRVRASLPNGQFVEGYAIKSKSEYWSEKYKNFGNYNLHNVTATAYTRATNRAISDLVGFGEVSAEEVMSRVNTEGDGKIEDAFG